MAESFLTSKALNLMYKIPTETFTRDPFVDRRGENGCRYEANLVVNKHPEYPDIPPSTWTVTLTVMDSDGEVWVDVEPKAGPGSLKIPNLVLVDWRVRGASMEVGDDDKMDPFRGDFYWYIGPEGFQRGRSESLKALLDTRYIDDERQYRLDRGPGVNVMVSLTFVVKNTTTCRVLGTLYESSLLADCKLVCGAREFPAHRAILAAQSPVFAAMFQNQMKEKSSGICTIKEMSPVVLDALLQFVYTKELTKTNGKLEELWNAADKYDMQDLKQECERLMLGSVTDDNAFSCLCFAEQHGLKKLKVEAAKMIISQESE